MLSLRTVIRLAIVLTVSMNAGGGALSCFAQSPPQGETKFRIVLDRGADVGQCFGSLFEVTSADGSTVIGAGFPNVYNTQNRADRHQLQFFVRPTSGERTFQVQSLGRPNTLCGTYLYGRDDVVYSSTGGLRAWDAASGAWTEKPSVGGTQESMRVGDGLLEFGESTVRYNGRTILEPPGRGTYQLFYYANGWLCFYHVDRGDKGYRPFENMNDGFSRLCAYRWAPGDPAINPQENAVTRTLPIVGETTFAWGVLGEKIVTGSNIGGFYVLDEGAWRMQLEPNVKVSYQLYSTTAFHDRLLMGQYPTGRLFEYDGQTITDRAGWPPVPAGVSSSAREAQTTAIYGGDLLVGVWPWGELWRYSPDAKKWSLMQRMFSHPELTSETIHPYDRENKGHPVSNQWGQRVTSLVTNGPDLFVSTCAKSACEWNPDQNPFLAPDKWKSYGTVYRLTMPGHLAASIAWTTGPTLLELTLRGATMTITQDGRKLAETTITGALASQLPQSGRMQPVRWRSGIYGQFGGKTLEGSMNSMSP
jgi:hypothetical protein